MDFYKVQYARQKLIIEEQKKLIEKLQEQITEMETLLKEKGDN